MRSVKVEIFSGNSHPRPSPPFSHLSTLFAIHHPLLVEMLHFSLFFYNQPQITCVYEVCGAATLLKCLEIICLPQAVDD